MPLRKQSTLAAWSVHLFTATGVLFGLAGLLAADSGDFARAFLWLGAALIVDGIDGTLARRVRVKERLPNVDGEALDLVVDYLTYVFVPAMIIWRGGYLPGTVAFALTGAILVSSLYTFARRDMKTQDGYFRGFPALWNVIAFYFYVMAPSQGVAAAVVALLVVMTFAPVHVAHPFRVKDYGAALPFFALAWAAFTAPLLISGLGIFVKTFLSGMSLATAAIVAAMGLVRTARGPRSQ